MLQPTLFLGTLFSLASTSIYFYIGISLQQRYIALSEAAWHGDYLSCFGMRWGVQLVLAGCLT